MMLPRLLLTPCNSDWWSSVSAKAVRRRCARFLDGDWLGLYNDSSPYGATDLEAQEAEQRAELQRVRREEREAASRSDPFSGLRQFSRVGYVKFFGF